MACTPHTLCHPAWVREGPGGLWPSHCTAAFQQVSWESYSDPSHPGVRRGGEELPLCCGFFEGLWLTLLCSPSENRLCPTDPASLTLLAEVEVSVARSTSDTLRSLSGAGAGCPRGRRRQGASRGTLCGQEARASTPVQA